MLPVTVFPVVVPPFKDTEDEEESSLWNRVLCVDGGATESTGETEATVYFLRMELGGADCTPGPEECGFLA